jgi:hypothetical protein
MWRATVHEWTMAEGMTHQIHLGVYQEAIRAYLLGLTPFPAEVILMTIVCTDAASQNTFFAPTMSGQKDRLTTHMFQARGLSFMMTSGKGMIDEMKTLCCMGGADRWILQRSCEDKVRMAAVNLGGETELRRLFP